MLAMATERVDLMTNALATTELMEAQLGLSLTALVELALKIGHGLEPYKMPTTYIL